jgi:hypothetical protein
VRFLGPVFDAPLLAALRRHACGYVHGHGAGGTNPSLLEALAEGCIVFAHDNPYNREVLEERAFYFRDAGELAAAIRRGERLSADARERLSAGGRARIAERYTWERIAGLYLELLGARRGSVEPGPRVEPGAPLPHAPSLLGTPGSSPAASSSSPALPEKSQAGAGRSQGGKG